MIVRVRVDLDDLDVWKNALMGELWAMANAFPVIPCYGFPFSHSRGYEI